MLSSITPLGERGRGSRWAVTATAYLLGSIVGGASLGGALGVAGDLLAGAADRLAGSALAPGGPVALVLAALVCLVAAASDLRLRGWSLPSWQRQVDEDWLARYRGWVYGLGYGFQLGLGVVTIVTSAATYAVFAFALLAGSWAVGLALGAVFGLVRALPVLGLAGLHDFAQLRALLARVERWSPRAARAAVAAEVAAAAAVLVPLVLSGGSA